MNNIAFEKVVSISNKYEDFITIIFENLTDKQEREIIKDINATFNKDFTGYLADLFVELSEEEILYFEDAISYYFPKETYEFLCSIIEKDAVDRYRNFGELPSMLYTISTMETIVVNEGNFDFEEDIK